MNIQILLNHIYKTKPKNLNLLLKYAFSIKNFPEDSFESISNFFLFISKLKSSKISSKIFSLNLIEASSSKKYEFFLLSKHLENSFSLISISVSSFSNFSLIFLHIFNFDIIFKLKFFYFTYICYFKITIVILRSSFRETF